MAEKPQLTFVKYAKGQYIIVEGKTAENFFIIRQGQAMLSKEAEIVRESDSNLLGPGDFFGVVSAMSSHSYIETVQALGDMMLVSVNRSQFEGLIQFNTPIAMKVIQQFSRRMRYLNDELTKLTLKSRVSEDETDALFKVGDFYRRKADLEKAIYAYRTYVTKYPTGKFARASLDNLKALAPNMPPPPAMKPGFARVYNKDAIIFAEGEPGDELYIIQSGTVKITKILDTGEIVLAVLKAGDMFGEMALLESKPRSANAIATGACVLMVIKIANFETMAATQPQIIGKLTQTLAERIWFSYKQLVNTQIIDPLGRMYDAMYMQLEKDRAPIEPQTFHTFSFGPQELAKMVGVPDREINLYVSKLLQEKIVAVSSDKVVVNDVAELAKLSAYYRKMKRRGLS